MNKTKYQESVSRLLAASNVPVVGLDANLEDICLGLPDDALLFSQRLLVERMVVSYWRDQNQPVVNAESVIIALDSLGLLDRAKVREEFKKSKGTTYVEENQG